MTKNENTNSLLKIYKFLLVPKGSKVITDCKSSYKSVAKENNWCLKQVKSKSYTDSEGNNLATINALHSELEYFFK